jgi:DNA-binding response OmpR family regulator
MFQCENCIVAFRLMLVEDDERIRKILTLALTDEGFDVIEAATGEDALANEHVEALDIAIVDLRLPGIGGIDVVRGLRGRTGAPIVILTAHGDANDVVNGLEAGADDFLNKPIAGRELVARLRAILRRSTSQDATGGQVTDEHEPISAGLVTVMPASYEAQVGDAPLTLTRTEFGVLRLLIERSPATVTRQELLETVWGYDYLGDSRLVDMQIYRLRQKLESHQLRDKLLTVRGVGFRLVP